MNKNKIILAVLFLTSTSLALFIGYIVGSKNPKQITSGNQVVATYVINGVAKSIQLQDISARLLTDLADQDRMIYQQKKQTILDIVNDEIRKNSDFTKIEPDPIAPEAFEKMLKAMNLDKRKITDRQRTDIMNNMAMGARNIKIKNLVEEKQKALALKLQLEPPFAFVKPQNPGRLLVSGDSKNPVEIIFYGNIHCPQCLTAYKNIQALESEHPNKIKIHFKYLGLDPDTSVAFKTAKALYCLSDSQVKAGAVGSLMKALFEKVPDSVESLSKTISNLQIAPAEMEKCLNSKENNTPLRKDSESGQELSKNPNSFFVINNYFVHGAEQKAYLDDLVNFILNQF